MVYLGDVIILFTFHMHFLIIVFANQPHQLKQMTEDLTFLRNNDKEAKGIAR